MAASSVPAPSVEIASYVLAAVAAGSPADVLVPAPDVGTAQYVLACIATGLVSPGVPAPTVELALYMLAVLYASGVASYDLLTEGGGRILAETGDHIRTET